MKKLAFKCILFVLIVATVIWLGGFLYRRSDSYRYLEYIEDSERFHQIPESIDVAVFGSSHGRDAFLYGPEDASFFNFAISSQTPRYDEMLMRQYGERFSADALVILTVSYMSPYWEESQSDFEQKQNRYYRTLDAENILDLDMKKLCFMRFSPLLTTELSDLVTSLFEEIPAESMDEGSVSAHRTSAEVMPSEMERIGRDHLSAIEHYYPEVNPLMWQAYENMLSMCRENGWQAVLVVPPYLAEYSACFDGFSQDFYENFCRQAETLAKKYDVPFLDYSRDAAFCSEYDLFKNIDHLNRYGAEAFDQRFFADLAALGIQVPAE